MRQYLFKSFCCDKKNTEHYVQSSWSKAIEQFWCKLTLTNINELPQLFSIVMSYNVLSGTCATRYHMWWYFAWCMVHMYNITTVKQVTCQAEVIPYIQGFLKSIKIFFSMTKLSSIIAFILSQQKHFSAA